MKKARLLFGLLSAFFICVVALTIIRTNVMAKDADDDIVIVIDAGHGAAEPGTSTVINRITEASINWQIAVSLKAELETYEGVKVYLTKGSAEYQSNSGRTRTGVPLGYDLFVSCHINSFSDTSAKGVQVYGTLNPNLREYTKKLCVMIANEVSSATGLLNGGYRTRSTPYDPNRDYYTVIDESAKNNIPGIIIEHAFASNRNDAAFLEQKDNQVKLGAADATAIAKFFGLSKRKVNAGESITLTRTYSAYMVGTGAGSFASTDETVAYVRSDGLITALKAGTATIIHTLADGTEEHVEVTVPQPQIIAIAGGCNPTFYGNEDNLLNFNHNNAMVKAIYSDGAAVEISVSEIAFGTAENKGNGIYDIPVSYGGVTGYIRLYVDSRLANNTARRFYPTGANKDIAVLPPYFSFAVGDFEGNPPIEPPTQAPTEPPTEAPTQKPTEAPTQKPTEPPTQKPTEPPTQKPTEPPTQKPTEPPTEAPTTEAPTTEAPTTEAPTTEAPTTEAPTTEAPTTETPTTAAPTTEAPTTQEPTTEMETTALVISDNHSGNAWIAAAVILGVAMVAGILALFISIRIRKRNKNGI